MKHSFSLKRVLLPGDEVMLKDGMVYINGTLLGEEYLKLNTKTPAGPFLSEGKVVKVPSGRYFILGDNRDVIDDSRRWGFFPTRGDPPFVAGKVIKCLSNCQ